MSDNMDEPPCDKHGLLICSDCLTTPEPQTCERCGGHGRFTCTCTKECFPHKGVCPACDGHGTTQPGGDT